MTVMFTCFVFCYLFDAFDKYVDCTMLCPTVMSSICGRSTTKCDHCGNKV